MSNVSDTVTFSGSSTRCEALIRITNTGDVALYCCLHKVLGCIKVTISVFEYPLKLLRRKELAKNVFDTGPGYCPMIQAQHNIHMHTNRSTNYIAY